MDATFINEITTVMSGVDGPTSIFIAGKMSMGLLIGTIVGGLLIGFFGLKLMRVFAALDGLTLGALLGFVIAGCIDVPEMAGLAIVAGCGIILAVLFCVLKKFGAFMLVLSWTFSVVIALAGLNHMVVFIVAVVLSLVLAILAVIFMEPVIGITSALAGAVTVAPAALMIAGLDSVVWLSYAATAVLVVVFALSQFMMQSRKIGKKEKVYSARVRKADSIESEVEKMRMLLDDDDE